MTRTAISLALALATVVAVVTIGSSPSYAKEPPGRCKNIFCEVEAERSPTDGTVRHPPESKRPGSAGSDSPATSGKSQAQRKYEADFAAYIDAVQAYRACSARGGILCTDPEAPIAVTFLGAGPTAGGGPAVQVTPGQAGAIAVARLKLPTVGPGIGPSPDLNRWKMAAVGYPLWLWADGPAQVGPVSDSVAGLSVSLRAEVSSLTFRMGDGTTVTCDGGGDRWTEAVQPGAQAPSCGHTYTKPSLPQGNYTVTAITNWAVTWTANGQSGVINVPAAQTTDLPVGELQVLVR